MPRIRLHYPNKPTCFRSIHEGPCSDDNRLATARRDRDK